MIYSKNFRICFAAAVSVILLFAIYKYQAGSEKIAVKKVEVHVVKNYRVELITTGRIEAFEETFVATKRGGRLDALQANEGDLVQAGQLLGVIDEAIHKSILEGSLSSFQLARQEWNRISKLASSGAATTQELDQARNNLSTKKSELEQARQRLEDGLIRAPKGGQISFLPFKIGENIPEGARVAVIEDTSQHKIQLAVQPKWLNKLPSSALIALWPFNETRDNKEVLVPVKISLRDPKQQTASSEFEVELIFEQLPENLRGKQIVNIALTTNVFPDAYTILQSAVLRLPDGPRLALVDANNILSSHLIKIIDQIDQQIVIEGTPPQGLAVVVAQDEKVLAKALKLDQKSKVRYF